MGSITAVPAVMRVHTEEIKMVEINFLCVHKKLRYEYYVLNHDCLSTCHEWQSEGFRRAVWCSYYQLLIYSLLF
jgi:Myristoyl-CoA:protein N-myristoyltransferase, N-terminal domain